MIALAVRLQWLLLAGAIVLGFFPPAESAFTVVKSDLFILTALPLVVVWMLGSGGRGRVPAAQPLMGPAACLLVLGAGQVLRGDPARELPEMMQLACGGGVLLVILSAADARRLAQYATWLVLILSLAAGFAVADHLWGPFITWERGFAGSAPSGTFGNPLFLAEGIILVIPWAVLRWLGSAGWVRRAWGLSLALLVHALLLTQGRGAWLGAAVALGGAGRLLAATGRLDRRKAARVAVGLCLLAGDVWLLSTHNPINRKGLDLWRHAHTLVEGGAVSGWQGRQMIWTATGRMARDRPLLGWGPGSVHVRFPLYQAALLAEPRYGALGYHLTQHSHQDVLQAAAERGVLGVGLLVWLLATWFRGVAPAAAGTDEAFALRGGAWCGMVAWIVAGLVNSPLHLPPNAQLFWIVLGVGWPASAVTRPAWGWQAAPSPRWGGLGWRCVAAVILLVVMRPFVRDLLSDVYLHSGIYAADHGEHRVALVTEVHALSLALEDRRQWFYIGGSLMNMKAYGRAEQAYRRDLEMNPGYASSWCNLGVAALSQDRGGDAIAALARAAELAPSEPEIFAYLATAHARVGHHQESVAAWNRAIALGYQGPLTDPMRRRASSDQQKKRTVIIDRGSTK